MDEMKKKLQDEAKEALGKARQEKNTMQQIRLICNVLAPDNFEKKFTELRGYIFGDVKTMDEKGYDKNQQPFSEIDQSSLDLIVERIFAKA